MAMSAALKEKRAKLRTRLQEKTISQLIPELEKAGVRGVSALNKKQLIEAVLALRVGPKTKSKQAKGSKHQYPGAGKGKDWHGEGPFRLMIIKGHNAGRPSVYANLGPYAAARGAIADAKTLLRQAAPVGKYELSNHHGRPLAEMYEGVDGYIVRAGPDWKPEDGDPPDLLAVIIQPTKKGGMLDKEAAYSPDVIDKQRLSKRRSMKLNKGRKNKNVSFTTRSGETVNFKTKKNSGRRNGFDSDQSVATELGLFIDNDSTLYHQQTQPIILNLARKKVKGVFDKKLAAKLFKYLADAGAKKYNRDMGLSSAGYGDFTPDVRRLAAQDLLDGSMEEINDKAKELRAAKKGKGRKRNPKAIPKTQAAFISEYCKLLDKWAGSREYLGAGKYTPQTKSAEKAGARLRDMIEAHYGWAIQASDRWETDQQLNRNPKRSNASASSLTTAQHAALNSLQYQDSLQDFNPTTVISLLRRGLIKKGRGNTYSLTAAGKQAPKGGGRIVSQDIYSNPRTNHHLVKGEHVKWSQQGILNVGWAGPHDKGRVTQVTKSGYVVDWGSGKPMPVPDKWLVDARSGSNYFPGSDYEGKTPGRGNPSRSASLQYEHVLREAYGDGSLQYYLALKRALDAGEVSGGSIVGSGYKSHKVKKLAHHWIDEQIRKLGPHENPDRWVRGVVKEMEEHGTVGAFTKQARNAGYKSTMEFARKVMDGWRSGAKKVYNKKTRRRQTITMKTMRRANFALNV